MQWKKLPLGPIQTNCYILWNDQKECIIFDPGAEAEKIQAFIEESGLRPLAVLLTHAHFDHIGALDEVRTANAIPACVHQKEADWLMDPRKNGSLFFRMGEIRTNPADRILEKEGTLEIGSFRFQIFETPGHSPGSVSFWLQEISTVFSGDALFAGSIGRTDLYGGKHQQLLTSIHEKLLSLPGETVVCPGHGPVTTVLEETSQNPFIQE
ncbi:MBL fold metallo-hydrolase [Heyndrickxia acidiproducens]|uniref:MBL fold metallo-hydrolase n=1 Tax=Heyndrickxia acidiproducens TaxID=1121084 RepID=UPI0003677A39|nr:MBL fold metallo-hydrolase [Heyndrickxia acidiproducens]